MSRVGRRTLLKSGITAGFGLGLVPRLGMGQGDAASVRAARGDLLIKAGDASKKPLTPADIRIGTPPILAWSMDPKDGTVRSGSRLNQVLLVRLDVGRLTQETRARSVDGVVAYSAICTHTGCEVEDWLKDEQVLHCPCHSSKFDPCDAAKVVDGEAPRPLPALPLRLDRGRLQVAGPFTTPVGFESV